VNAIARRIVAGAALAVAPALLALSVAAGGNASTGVPNPGPQVYAGQHDVGGVNGTGIKPGSREHHHHQKAKARAKESGN
jgi:hypothetical protein